MCIIMVVMVMVLMMNAFVMLACFLSFCFPPKNAAGKDKKILRESFLEMFHSLKVLLDTVDVLFL